jgi:hypothetical protein
LKKADHLCAFLGARSGFRHSVAEMAHSPDELAAIISRA